MSHCENADDPCTVTPTTVRAFRKLIYDFYREHGRAFPWRATHNPYHILVSEIMLQQTQTERVADKYEQFVNSFPDFSSWEHGRAWDTIDGQ
jgi:A/G-specific adenine glycosylase